jgi:hypothetical protein
MPGGGSDCTVAIYNWLADSFYHAHNLDTEIHLASAIYIMRQNTDLLFHNVTEIQQDLSLFEIVLYCAPYKYLYFSKSYIDTITPKVWLSNRGS